MSKVFIIAEAGVNHNGSIERAMQMIDVASEAGANAVKFQTFKSESVIRSNAPKAPYQLRNTGSVESQLAMAKKLELTPVEHKALAKHCAARGIQFLSTPFDLESLAFLKDEMNVSTLKIASGEITNAPLLLEAGRSGLSLIVSTGMCNLDDVERALAVVSFGLLGLTEPSWSKIKESYSTKKSQEILRKKVSLLHCTTEYPAPYEDVNLNAMCTLRDKFGLNVGYSDHTEGGLISCAAVALGATIVEKHFTLDKKLPGPDHAASLEPQELTHMIRDIRTIELALGSGEKKLMPSEMENIKIARKSLVANRVIRKGERFAEGSITVKRPATGISPMKYWDVLGTVSTRDFNVDEDIVE